MPVFISYSHADAEFVNDLAARLVTHNTHVWVDKWELNVGDSFVEKLQQEIQGASALLVVLSNASVASEWCMKELSTGLTRELDEKRVIVLPVLVEDCAVPDFLREKVYADFRHDFEGGIKSLLEGLARITSPEQGRITSGKGTTDWAADWGYEGQRFRITYMVVEAYTDWPFTLLTEIAVRCNDPATKRYEVYVNEGLEWLGRVMITESLAEFAEQRELRLVLHDQFPQVMQCHLADTKRKIVYDITIRCRRLGEDNGKDQVVHVANYMRAVRDYARQVARKPTQDEFERLLRIISKSDA